MRVFLAVLSLVLCGSALADDVTCQRAANGLITCDNGLTLQQNIDRSYGTSDGGRIDSTPNGGVRYSNGGSPSRPSPFDICIRGVNGQCLNR